MSTASPRAGRRPRERKPSPEEYATFIRQIELDAVWLGAAEVKLARGPGLDDEPVVADPPGDDSEGGDVHIFSWAGWSACDAGFYAWHHYQLEIERDEKDNATIQVVFGLRFSSRLPMTKQLFALFEDVNLPVNTWPYLREFVASTVSRMGWTAITLPALKRRTGEPETNAAPSRRRVRG